ncbi:MAG: organic solvent tolerance protein OstA [Pirellulales bacterium]
MHFTFCISSPINAQTTPPPTRLPTVDSAVQPAQFTPPPLTQPLPLPFPQTVPAPAPAGPRPTSVRSVELLPRYEGLGPQFDPIRTSQGESILAVNGGINVIVRGLSVEGLPDYLGPLGDVDIETDRAVIWSLDFASLGQSAQQNDQPLEIYMEGNIVFRQGDRIVYADRMFYDIRNRRGLILGAELLTPLPQTGPDQYQGLVRLKAAALRQLDESHFVAHDALLTTSRLEEPSYNLSSDTITFEDIPRPAFEPYAGIPAVDPVTLQPRVDHEQLVESQNNFLYVSGIPIFYWPSIKTDLQKPTYYIDNVRIRNDSIFGFQALVAADAFQLFSLERPDGVNWTLDLDYLSERGLGFGTDVEYDRDSFLGIAGPTKGRADLWAISDDGRDNLGLGRRTIDPEKSFRGRAFWNHRQHLVGGLLDGWTTQAEVGWISDRTFLEQYYENEWDNNKDQLTGVRLKRIDNNQALSIEANARINDFFTQTEWLPRLDHYWLGEPLAGNTLTWFEHSQAAYANIGLASTPTSPDLVNIHTLLPWEFESGVITPIDAAGERLVTRQEIDYPLDFAPFKVVPYALGELAHWGADINGDDIQRAYFQTGLRASIPFWAVDPTIRDPLFNLNGLAHKVVFDAEISYADANRNITDFPLYDELDDDSIEEFRRRLFFSPFAGGLAPYYDDGPPSTIDGKFDPRFYALRSGMQSWVTSPTTEIADDLTAVRLGMRHRLQTKRGPLGAQHIVDWFTFDSNATWFPREDRDNFGTGVGLVDYDLRWHLGDRFTVLSDGAADFFGDGLRTASIGVLLNRPARGNAYLGFRALDGPIQAEVVTATLNYRMGPKWIGSASTSVDLGDGGNIGQAVAFSRIGESLVATLGAHVDASKDNVGVSFLVEPRFLPKLSVTRKTGIEVPPTGAQALE